MPRTGRVVLPGYCHHVLQRGHNRQLVFAETRDFLYYLESLRVWKREYGVRLYGYCLMSNHVHLILEPGDVASLGQLMKRVAGRQTRYFNRQQGRCGTLWGGRYKSSPIETERYLLACCRYVDLNPVRARMVARPEDYIWSGYRERVGLPTKMKLLDMASFPLSRNGRAASDQERYSRFVKNAVPDEEVTVIRTALQRGQLTGGAAFVDKVEAVVGLRIEHRGPGRCAKLVGK